MSWRCGCRRRRGAGARGRVLSRRGVPRVVRRRRGDPDGARALRTHVARQVRPARHGSSRLSVRRPVARRPALLRTSPLPRPGPRRRAGEPTAVPRRAQDLPVRQLPMRPGCVRSRPVHTADEKISSRRRCEPTDILGDKGKKRTLAALCAGPW